MPSRQNCLLRPLELTFEKHLVRTPNDLSRGLSNGPLHKVDDQPEQSILDARYKAT